VNGGQLLRASNIWCNKQKQNKLRGLNPRANYTDWATTACRQVQTFADRGCHVVGVTDPYGRILGFLDRSHYFSIK
jgi:CBS-domain-containing membrane protein